MRQFHSERAAKEYKARAPKVRQRLGDLAPALLKLPWVPWTEIMPYVKRARRGDKAAWGVIIGSSRAWIYKCAKKYNDVMRLGLGEDLISAGICSLRGAVRKFDPEKSNWGTYARLWVSAAIRRAASKAKNVISSPMRDVDMGAKAHNKDLEVSRMSATWNNPALNDYVADRQDNHEPTCKQPHAPANAISAEVGRLALARLKGLDALSGNLLRLRYGIGGERQHTINEAAARLGMTRVQVRALESQALRRLQDGEGS